MKFTKHPIFIATIMAVSFTACTDDDDATTDVQLEVPTNYNFTRNGESTVNFSGQTTRILMADELNDRLLDFSIDDELLLNQFSNENDPFSSSDLNDSDKSIKSKVAASADYFSTNLTLSATIKNTLESWLSKQANEIFPFQDNSAQAGEAGQLADGDNVRYVNAQGLEFNQLFTKSLIGALMVDQTLNNYLSPAVLDEGQNREENDSDILAEGKTYTTMEHKWDEAYGYLYGTSENPANPNDKIGEADDYLNKYIGRVENDEDFSGIAERIFNAFKTGRAAIVAKDYDIRDEQANIIQQEISNIIGIRAVYYLEQAKSGIATENWGTAFHDLSEAYGFIYSLQFTKNPATNQPYFNAAEVDDLLTDLMDDGEDGLWDVSVETLSTISEIIAAEFDFTIEQAGS
ncbi:DUF4856 domain-containing protein [Gangjinia marincola]|uniref:DUF4856 domain-containing protein n=1 Tax=Gangjinia marincola TaxID=578463 RepID=A0ABN1MIN0_9FLAO